MREVPRHIDAPNRAPEYAFTSMFVYYSLQYIFQKPLISFIFTILANYIVYRITIGKPEGAMYRLIYKLGGLGKFIPSPRKIKRFEI